MPPRRSRPRRIIARPQPSVSGRYLSDDPMYPTAPQPYVALPRPRACGALSPCLRPSPALAAEIFSANNSRCIRNVVKPARRNAIQSLVWLIVSSIGDRPRHRATSDLRSVGIARASTCSGGGNPNRGDLPCPGTCRPSSVEWPWRIPPGGKNASPTNSCSNSACGSLHEPCANTCPVTASAAQANAINLNAGPHLSAIMLKALSRVTSARQSRRHSASSMSLW